MKNIFRNILIASIVLSFTCAPTVVYAMPEPVPAGQTEKQKAAAAKAKEAAKKKKQKEAEKKKKEAEKKKKAAERARVASEREAAAAKNTAQTEAREAKAKREYARYQEELEHPKTEVVSLFNLGLRLGYAAMMDKMAQNDVQNKLKGGVGAGLDLTYGLEYGHLRFETGLDLRFLNSTSTYGFTAVRNDLTYGAKYNYLFDNLSEMRNMFQVGVPVMIGAQFNRYYFLVGAKVHYSVLGTYSHKGLYDITVEDPALVDPYGMGIHAVNGQTNTPIKFSQPDLSIAAEVGIDLDEWLQKQPDKKKKTKVKPGERLPFGREHVHYRAALFAEYGVLNTNGTKAAQPVEFTADQVSVQKTNTLLAWNGDTKLNNLFVGAKFIIQFEVPGKKARPVPPPPSYAIYSVVDATTNQPINAFIETKSAEGDKIAMRERQIGANGIRQRHPLGAYTVDAKAEGYYNAMQSFDIAEVGSTEYVTIRMRPRPVFRLRVTNKETGLAVPAAVRIIKSGETEPAYTLATDSANGAARQMLAEGPQYRLVIEQMGYDKLEQNITYVGDSINLQLAPIKKGEVFIVKNLHFATNKTRILPISEEALNDLYMYLARNPQLRIKIIGHTDNVGKDAANQKLSDGRANAVREDLIERGIAADRIEAEGRGESQPIDTNDTEEGRQNNRRVEIEIL